MDPLNDIEESSLETDLTFQCKLWPWLWSLLPWVFSCQVALVLSTLALIPCWELGRARFNSNSLLDNYLWAYFLFLCLLFLAYYVFHQVNYQNTWDTNLGSSSQGQTSPSWRGKPTSNSSYRLSVDKYHEHDTNPWLLYTSKTLSLFLSWLLMLIFRFCTVQH